MQQCESKRLTAQTAHDSVRWEEDKGDEQANEYGSSRVIELVLLIQAFSLL